MGGRFLLPPSCQSCSNEQMHFCSAFIYNSVCVIPINQWKGGQPHWVLLLLLFLILTTFQGNGLICICFTPDSPLSPVKKCVPLTHTVHLTPSPNSPIPLWVSVWKSFYPSTATPPFPLFNTRLHTIIKPWGLRDPGQKCKRNATFRPLSSLTPTSHWGGVVLFRYTWLHR